MSTELRTVQTFRGPLALFEIAGAQFCGGDPIQGRPCLQLTQGAGGGPDKPGFIQLSVQDAERLALALQEWVIAENVERTGYWGRPFWDRPDVPSKAERLEAVCTDAARVLGQIASLANVNHDTRRMLVEIGNGLNTAARA